MPVANPIIQTGIPEIMLASRRQTLQEQMLAEQLAREQAEREAAQQQLDATAKWYLNEYDRLNPLQTETILGPEPPGGVGPRWQADQYNEDDMIRRQLFAQLPVDIQGRVVDDIRKQRQALEERNLQQNIENEERMKRIAAVARFANQNGIPTDSPQYQALMSQVTSGVDAGDLMSMMPQYGNGASVSPEQVYNAALTMGWPDSQAQIFAAQAAMSGRMPNEMFKPTEYVPPQVQQLDMQIASVKEEMVRLESLMRATQEMASALVQTEDTAKASETYNSALRRHQVLQAELARLQAMRSSAFSEFQNNFTNIEGLYKPGSYGQTSAGPIPGQQAAGGAHKSAGIPPSEQPQSMQSIVNGLTAEEKPGSSRQPMSIEDVLSTGRVDDRGASLADVVMQRFSKPVPPDGTVQAGRFNKLSGNDWPRISVMMPNGMEISIPQPRNELDLVVVARTILGLGPHGPLTDEQRAEVARMVAHLANQVGNKTEE